jgi:hypothetical protein
MNKKFVGQFRATAHHLSGKRDKENGLALFRSAKSAISLDMNPGMFLDSAYQLWRVRLSLVARFVLVVFSFASFGASC